jgi:hypothetical protein
VKGWRIILAVVGIGLASFGVFRLATEIPPRSLAFLGLWLAAALVIHDGIVAPATVGISSVLRRSVPDRGRRYLQAALIASAMVTVIALPMIYLRGSQPAVKALLLRNYGADLAAIVGCIALVSLACYLVQVVRDRSAPSDHGQPTTGQKD